MQAAAAVVVVVVVVERSGAVVVGWSVVRAMGMRSQGCCPNKGSYAECSSHAVDLVDSTLPDDGMTMSCVGARDAEGKKTNKQNGNHRLEGRTGGKTRMQRGISVPSTAVDAMVDADTHQLGSRVPDARRRREMSLWR
jgi:hypothetical protein